ncbi:MAG: prephenate dehydrogenase/arogenate dehydrogenase family protein [Spirochaetales bacterium]|nr:prephenate dehydrogenase/arogenate dehydrogenase family protein [Spirochaetales bacterium]
MNIGIYGLGRFGSFWGREIAHYGSQNGWQVKGFSRNPERGTPEGVIRVEEEELLSSDVIILCNAISSMESVLGKISTFIKPGTLVMDTCSVKVHPTSLMNDLLAEGVNILGTHPMFGPDSGKNGIAGLPIVVSPVRAPLKVQSQWKEIFRDMKLDVKVMTPDEHDLEAAFTQGITHFIGRVLGRLDLKPSPIGTMGYRELIKIVEQTCNDPEQLFLDLQKFNPHTEEMRLQLKYALNDTLGQL